MDNISLISVLLFIFCPLKNNCFKILLESPQTGNFFRNIAQKLSNLSKIKVIELPVTFELPTCHLKV